MKKITLLEHYKFTKKIYSFAMPLISLAFFVMSIVTFFKYSNMIWSGFIFLGIAIMVLVIYIFIRKYLNKKIIELESRDNDKKEGDQ